MNCLRQNAFAINAVVGKRYCDQLFELERSFADLSPEKCKQKRTKTSKPPRGAKASAILYSLVETAKECSLDPCKYLTDILQRAANGNLSDSAFLESLLPIPLMTATLN